MYNKKIQFFYKNNSFFSAKLVRALAAGIIAITTVFAYASEADLDLPSNSKSVPAYRAPGEPYEAAQARTMRKTGRHRSFLVLPGKPETESFPADENGIALLKNLVEPWSSEQPIDRMFHRAFDRYLPWYEPLTGTQYDRRISWRYPRDGCFNRAELLNNRIKQFGFPALQKIFVFGNLATRTPDAPEGKVRWWYHVAPVTQVNNEILVIDPALDKKAPMPITQWLNTLVNAVNKRTSKDMKIAICDANAYTPMSSCNGGQQINDSNLRKGATKYLDAEWENMRLIGLDPYSELLSQR